jgi:hypothetical protein
VLPLVERLVEMKERMWVFWRDYEKEKKRKDKINK